MYELVIIAHFATGASYEEVVARDISSQIRCQLMGLRRLGRRLGAPDIAFRCDKMKKETGERK